MGNPIISNRKLNPLRVEIAELKTGANLKESLMKLESLFSKPLDNDILIDLFGFEVMKHYYYPSMQSDTGYNKIPETITICGGDYKWTIHGVIILTIDDFVNILNRNNVRLYLTKYAINKYF